MTALVLTFLAAFIGTALLIREAREYRTRYGRVIGGILLLSAGVAGMLLWLLRWAVS